MIGALGPLNHFARLFPAGNVEEAAAPQLEVAEELAHTADVIGRFGQLPAGLAPTPELSSAGAEHEAYFPQRVRSVAPSDHAGLRAQHYENSVSTTFEFELTTQDGDRLTLQFEQTDFQSLSQTGFAAEAELSSERAISVSVVGNISKEEQVAIDQLLSSVTEIADRFFAGDLAQPASLLASLDFDPSQLASVSLDLSREQSTSLTQVFERPASSQLASLASRNPGVAELLESLGSGQKRMIEALRETFAAQDAVGLTQGLLSSAIAPDRIGDALLG